MTRTPTRSPLDTTRRSLVTGLPLALAAASTGALRAVPPMKPPIALRMLPAQWNTGAVSHAVINSAVSAFVNLHNKAKNNTLVAGDFHVAATAYKTLAAHLQELQFNDASVNYLTRGTVHTPTSQAVTGLVQQAGKHGVVLDEFEASQLVQKSFPQRHTVVTAINTHGLMGMHAGVTNMLWSQSKTAATDLNSREPIPIQFHNENVCFYSGWLETYLAIIAFVAEPIGVSLFIITMLIFFVEKIMYGC